MTAPKPASPAILSPDRFAVLLGGPISVTERLRAQIADRRVIAADSGIAHATALDCVPELWVGDFDSATETDRTLYKAVPRAEFPADKDMSDGALALEAACDRGAADMLLVGALGGVRSDHALLNLFLALQVARAGIPVVLDSGHEEGLVLLPDHSLSPDWPAGTVFSVLPVEPTNGLTIEGARWPLQSVRVMPGDSWTLSNAVSEQGALRISVTEGAALVVAHLVPEAER